MVGSMSDDWSCIIPIFGQTFELGDGVDISRL